MRGRACVAIDGEDSDDSLEAGKPKTDLLGLRIAVDQRIRPPVDELQNRFGSLKVGLAVGLRVATGELVDVGSAVDGVKTVVADRMIVGALGGEGDTEFRLDPVRSCGESDRDVLEIVAPSLFFFFQNLIDFFIVVRIEGVLFLIVRVIRVGWFKPVVIVVIIAIVNTILLIIIIFIKIFSIIIIIIIIIADIVVLIIIIIVFLHLFIIIIIIFVGIIFLCTWMIHFFSCSSASIIIIVIIVASWTEVRTKKQDLGTVARIQSTKLETTTAPTSAVQCHNGATLV